MDTNLAVLIDFENIAAGTEKEGLGRFDVTAIMQRLVDKGRVLIARSYADWGRFSRFKQSLLTANVTMYELTSHGMQDKNRADIAMVVDALELAFTKDYIDTFVIVSGDSDFTPLVLKMRELNKRVIGIGTRSSTSRLLVNACDEFIFYNSIVASKRKRNVTTNVGRGGKRPGRRQASYNLLIEALQGLQREDPQAPLASIVKNAMRRKSSDFSETELGYTTFATFLESAVEAGYVSIERDRKAGGYRVDVARTDSGQSSDEDENSNWTDPYLKEDFNAFITPLAEKGLDPLSHPIRMQVLSLIEEIAEERGKKRRKVNAQFVREDVRKRLRKTVPDLPSSSLRGIFSALMQGGLLIHRDGTAIRSASAPFRLEKDAEGLNRALLNFYLGALEEADADLHDVEVIAELFLGERSRKRDVEEALAWLAQAQAGGPAQELNELDLDDLLVLEDTAEVPKVTLEDAVSAGGVPEPAAPEEAETEVKAAEVEEKPKAKPKPKRKSRAKAKPKADTAEKAPVAAAEADAAEEAPKKRTRRRVRRKPTDEAAPVAATDGNDIDLDALLS